MDELIELLRALTSGATVKITFTISLDNGNDRQPYLAKCPYCEWAKRYSWESGRDKGLRTHIQRKHSSEQKRATPQQNGRSAQ